MATSHFQPTTVNGRRIIPYVYVASALAEHCASIARRNAESLWSWRFRAEILVGHVTVYMERGSYCVTDVLTDTGLDAMYAVAEALTARGDGSIEVQAAPDWRAVRVHACRYLRRQMRKAEP